jgi:ABC-2 type transport system ATP-binding protein
VSLVVDSITKRFGPVVALDGVSFTVQPGRIFGLLGANGAGKTTSMRIVLDILHADSGSVTWQGQPNDRLPRRTWGYLPEERGLYLRMKVVDVLAFFAALYGVSPARAVEEVEDWLERFRIRNTGTARWRSCRRGTSRRSSSSLPSSTTPRC